MVHRSAVLWVWRWFVKRAICYIGLLLEAALLVAPFVLDYFARARLGMSRWLGYHNQKWEAALPMHAMEVIAVGVLVVLLIVSVVMYARSTSRRKLTCVSIIASGTLLGIFTWFVVAQSVATARAYYLMALCLFLAALLQAIQSVLLARADRSG